MRCFRYFRRLADQINSLLNVLHLANLGFLEKTQNSHLAERIVPREFRITFACPNHCDLFASLLLGSARLCY